MARLPFRTVFDVQHDNLTPPQVIGLFPFLAGSPTHTEQRQLTLLCRWPFIVALISALIGILPRRLTKAVVTAWAGARIHGDLMPAQRHVLLHSK